MILKRKFSIQTFDLAIIGGGPAGYVSAIHASQLGLKTVCIDNKPLLGGTCINTGCIPSKTLLKISQKYSQLFSLKRFGLFCEQPAFNWPEILKIKDKTIQNLGNGIEALFKKNSVINYQGIASFKNKHIIEVHSSKLPSFDISANNFIIATGSSTKTLPGFATDEQVFFTSTGLMNIPKVPKHLVILGAGIIGIELGSIFKSLGSKVTLVEISNQICPELDADLSKEFQKYLTQDGFQLVFNSNPIRGKIDPLTGLAIIELQDFSSSSLSHLTADACLVAVGRCPNIRTLGLENLNIDLNLDGQIPVNNLFQTNYEHIYAIGDVIAGPMLAHKAEQEAIAVTSFLAGQDFILNYDAIPNIVYTDPEIAWVGKTQQQLTQLGIPFKVGLFSMNANSRARSNLDSQPGLVKLISHRDTDRLLGAHIISKNAGEMIHELSLAIQQKASSEDIARTSHAHPTLSEAIREAAMAITSKPIHA